MIIQMVLLFSFMIIISESGPLEDSNLEEDEVEEEFDPSCLPTTNSTDENSDEVDLLQECEEDSECPSKWSCFMEMCFPPDRRNKYFRNLKPVSAENVAIFKASFIPCTGIGLEGCKCPSGFKCDNERCTKKPSNSTISLAQVGGVRKLKLTRKG